MLTYLTGSIPPGIAMAKHHCARFSVFPMHSHEQAVMRIGWYLLSTHEKGMTYKPDSLKGIEVYMLMLILQADGIQLTLVMPTTSIQERGLSFDLLAVPFFWQSKLQTEIALSTAEAEHIALSQALRETISMVNLMKEINVIFPLYLPQPKFIIKV
jgi:hypothetical protein